jgi:glycosyltransferase involved in cell wall biosynthesis
MVKISIIIPTAGSTSEIKAAIQSLLTISPEKYAAEIIIIDNNFSEELSKDLHAYIQTVGRGIRYYRERSPGSCAARHRGATEARGELLTFIDDDVEATEGWLAAIQNAFTDPEVAIVGGPSIPKFRSSIPSWFWDYIGSTPYGGWMCTWLSFLNIGHDVLNINPNYVWTLNFSIRKHLLNACGGFHPDLVPERFQRWQGDGETGFTMKFQEAGYRADYLQDVKVLHLCRPERLSVEYFNKRAYFQGVSDSFTQIRKGTAPLSEQTTQASTGQAPPVFPWSSESAQVKRLTDQAYRDGWMFHQREVAADPVLLAWVRRENYFGADIREEIPK